MNSSEYKLYHEKRMQNNLGTSLAHTFFCIFPTIFCALICSGLSVNSRKIPLAAEYCIIIVTLILTHTLFADNLYLINVLIFTSFMAIIFTKRKSVNINLNKQNVTLKSPAVTIMRALTYLITIFAILAVDFKIFPRYLAKTEKYGYSLMDTGVGLFVLMSGIVHKTTPCKLSIFVQNNSKLVAILLVLGILRIVAVKFLQYQEHVSEYGVHWNFFFTMAITKAVSSFLLLLTKGKHSLILSFLLLIIHETLLAVGVQDWVFSEVERDSFLSANKEGVSSCLGYVSMYLFAVHYKEIILNKTSRRNILLNLVLSSCLMFILAVITNYFRPTSRTLANTSYCTYLGAIFLSFTSILFLFESVFELQGKKLYDIPHIINIVNQNGLLLFLIANLLTGFVNLSIQTLLTSDVLALFILNCYMIVILFIGEYLKIKGIRI